MYVDNMYKHIPVFLHFHFMLHVFINSSGAEGYYPDLTRHAEERLAVIKPKSAILRKSEPILRRNMLDPSVYKEIDTDINDWTSEMHTREKDLEEGKSNLLSEFLPQPGVREYREESIKVHLLTINFINVILLRTK